MTIQVSTEVSGEAPRREGPGPLVVAEAATACAASHLGVKRDHVPLSAAVGNERAWNHGRPGVSGRVRGGHSE